MVKRRGPASLCISELYPTEYMASSSEGYVHSSLRCLMVIRSTACPTSPCYVHTKLHPEHTSHQGDSCGCHRLYIRPCGMDNVLQTPPAHQEQQPYLFSLDFSSSHILESIYQDQGARKAIGGDRKQMAIW